MNQKSKTRKSERGASQASAKYLTVAIAMLMVSVCFSIPFSDEAQALDFVENMAVPWTSSFTPLDSAWDANGTQCVVVGNDTSAIQPSAWLYNDPSSTWYPIHEGTDPGAKINKRVTNMDTGMIYGTIQQAINNASAGDRIYLWSGTYNETLTINKPLTLHGNGSANTVLNGRNLATVILVTASGVNLTGLKVTGGSSYPGILLYKVQNCRIENCSVEGNGDGICITGSSNNIIKNNYIQNNAGVGVKTEDSEAAKSLVGLTESGGDSGCGTMFTMDQSGANYTLMYQFNYGYTDGLNPQYARFIQDQVDPNILYGMTPTGGQYNRGIIFRMNKDGSGYQLLHEFRVNVLTEGYNPYGSLTQYNSRLYGLTMYGGMNGVGAIFRMNTDGTGYSTIYNFTSASGSYPRGSLTLVGATFYGMTYSGGTSGYGVVFRINTDGTGYTALINFSRSAAPNYGSYPYGSLTLDTNMGNALYGMTYSGGGAGAYGCVFRMNLDGSGYKSILNFTNTAAPSWGRNPYGSLIQSGTTLYGMTYIGGTGFGTIFRVSTDGTGYKCMYNFTTTSGGYYPYGSLVQDANSLYGMASTGSGSGTVFSINKLTNAYISIHPFTNNPDGASPYGTLMYDGSAGMCLYGMTNSGGIYYGGIAFRISRDGLAYQKLHDFDNRPTNGRYPYGKVAQNGEYLYGATTSGGTYSGGCIFRTDLDGNGFTMLHSFDGMDGSYPSSCPIIEGGVLYGTTANGGPFGDDCGVLYRMNLDGSGYAILHEFLWDGLDGAYPYSPPLLVGGFLYGMTQEDSAGSGGYGTMYRVDTSGNNYQILYYFGGQPLNDGAYPRYGQLVYDGAMLYGTTNSGGTNNRGTVFRAAPDGSSKNLLYSFSISDGSYPYGSLALDGTTLYGITESGGANGYGVIFRIDTSGSGFNMLRSLSTADGTYPNGGLTLDGSMLYGMTNSDGPSSSGTVFRMNKDTLAFSVLHAFADSPDGAYPYGDDIAVITHPALTSSDNIIYHNNIIGNTVQALNDDLPVNLWSLTIGEGGGNYWSEYVDVDLNGDGIYDTPRTIPDVAGAMDSYPWIRRDGWVMPYTTFKSVAWDNVNRRFWICGEVSSDARSTLYYIPAVAPTTMVPIMAPPITFTALAADNQGNIMIGANDQMACFYYDSRKDNGYSIVENGTGGMYGWNITGISFNPVDQRFYMVGNVKDMDVGIAFVTDPLPLNQSGKKCYIDTSDFMNLPGIKGLKSISWNPVRNYSIAVGDGVYKLMPYNGNAAHSLTWSTIKAPETGRSYFDISWDKNGWNEAGIVGQNGTYGSYWRYYHTNQHLLDGNTSSISGTKYMTCAMKPPSSPKWLLIPHPLGSLRVNIQEKDESGTIIFSANKPQIFSVKIWKQTDLLRPNLLNRQVDADSTYTFFVEGNYTVGGMDMWSGLTINIAAWYDNGAIGLASAPEDPTWGSQNSRTKQFNLTYSPGIGASMVYPLPPPIPFPIIREFFIASWWENPMPLGSDGKTHQVMINVTFKQQTWAADGTGFANGPVTGGAIWDKASALNDPNSWDMKVHMYDAGNSAMYNTTYEEFGIKEFASIISSGTPSGSAPPGQTDLYLGNCTLHYSSNVPYFVTVKIPDLHMNGDPLNPLYIPANNLYVQNNHSYSDPAYSDMDSQTYFSFPNTPICIWGSELPSGIGTPITAPWHGTESAGPLYSDYLAASMSLPFELTKFSWWIDVPVSVSAGVYLGTITITISDSI